MEGVTGMDRKRQRLIDIDVFARDVSKPTLVKYLERYEEAHPLQEIHVQHEDWNIKMERISNDN